MEILPIAGMILDDFTAIASHLLSQEERVRELTEALEKIKSGIDHPEGIQRQPEFYQAISWAVHIADEALSRSPNQQ